MKLEDIKAISVLYAKKVPGTFFAARLFPGVQKTVLLGIEGMEFPELPPGVEVVLRPSWSRVGLLDELSRLSVGYDLTYFAWADCPLLDGALAASLAERHLRYAAEYSYADGWPYGFAPEILAPGTAGILAKLCENDDGPVERDMLFKAIEKDINAFDIETEISPWDLRPYRLSLTADSKRNLLLLSRLMGESASGESVSGEDASGGAITAASADRIITEKQTMIRTLPAFFNIQVVSACPQACSLCPWPAFGGEAPVSERKGFMPKAAFAALLDKIADFAGDAVISLSLWGELALHPEHDELIRMVLQRPELSLVIETSGIGWKEEELKSLALASSQTAPREYHAAGASVAPLSWIVSLDACDPARYREVRGPGFSEASSCAMTLLSLFPKDAYVQAVRVKDSEDDIEQFFRYWKDNAPEGVAGKKDARHVIIQKYDDFAGALPKRQATDLSPVKRRPCWHIQRDMNILLDGRVPCCREDLAALKGEGAVWGNAFTEELAVIWEKGAALYDQHCKEEYQGRCALCDEFYTFNF